MIHFDPKTLTSWKERNIDEVSCSITDSGCAGHTISIVEGRDHSLDSKIEQSGLTLYIQAEHIPAIDGGYITWTGKKWILKSDAINTRCGCGKSFSWKTGNPLQDKVVRMKMMMKEKKEGAHI